jgi:tetratricopeptide (TPR) repeat protein
MVAPVIAACLLLMSQATAPHEDSLAERIRQAPLAPEQRIAVTSSLASGNYARIDSVLTAAAGANPGHAAELYALLGAIYFVGHYIDRAVVAFQHADSLSPLSTRDRFTFAMALVNLSYTQAARAQLELLNRNQPEQSLYLYWLARIDYDQRRYEDAIAKLRRVIELDPQSARAWDSLGLALDMFANPEEARTALEKAVELNRRLAQPSPWPPNNLGMVLLRLESWKAAETALRESLRYDPRFAMAHYHLGRVLEKEGRDAEAMDEYRSAISLDPSLAEPCYSLGLLYKRLKRPAEADEAFAELARRKAMAGKAPPK